MGNQKAAGRRSPTAMVAENNRARRWFGLLMAVPLAAGGTNGSCEVDAPPQGAEAGDRAEERGSHQEKDRDRRKDRKKAKAAGDENKKERGRSREIICVVSAEAPTVAEEGSPLIVGEASYWCESPGADRLTVVVRVQQRHDDGAWVTVASSRDTVVGVQTVRKQERAEHDYARRATASCQSGTFRTLVVAKRSAGGDAKVLVDNSFQTTDPCDP